MAQHDAEGSLPCPAWVWSTGSNTHVAKDRSWFGSDYTPIDSTIFGTVGRGPVPVVGIGTVASPPGASGPASHATLRLENVLHAPGVISNTIGYVVGDKYACEADYASRTRTITDLRSGRPVAHFEPGARFLEVRLSEPPVGPRVGPSPYKPNVLYCLSVDWPDAERARVRALLASSRRGAAGAAARRARATDAAVAGRTAQASAAVAGTPEAAVPSPPLTASEKRWLKTHFGGEYKFLRAYGMSIYKEGHREEGRRILRGLLSKEERKTGTPSEKTGMVRKSSRRRRRRTSRAKQGD